MLKKLILITALTALKTVNAQDISYTKTETPEIVFGKNHPVKDERQYLTADFIRLQGISRLSELLSFIDKAYFYNYNNISALVNINGSTPNFQQNYLLFINGIKVEMPRVNLINLNLLGIEILDIAYVEIINTPQVIGGQLVTQGGINIITRKDEKGLSVKSHYQISQNNSSAYPSSIKSIQTKPSMVSGTSLGYFGNKGHINTSFLFQNQYLPDSATYNFYNQQGYLEPTQPLLGYRTDGAIQLGKYHLEAAYSNTNQKTLETDFANGNAVLLNSKYTTTLARITKQVSERNAWRITGSFSNLQYLFYNRYLEFGWLHNRVTANKKMVNNNLFLNLERTELSNITPYQEQLSLALLNQLSFKPNKKTTHQIALQVKYLVDNKTDQHIPATTYTYTFNKQYNLISSTNFSFTYKTLPYHDFLNRNWLLDYTLNQPGKAISPAHLFAVNYFKCLNFNGNFRLTFFAGAQSNINNVYYVFWATNFYDRVVANVQTLKTVVNIHYNVLNNFWVDADYNYNYNYSNSANAARVLEQIPRHKFVLSGNYKLTSTTDLSLRSVLTSTYTSQVYQNTTFNLPSNNNMPSTSYTDIVLNQKIAKDKIRLAIGAKNVFNQQVMYNAIGPDFNARYFVSATVQLQQIGKKTPKP